MQTNDRRITVDIKLIADDRLAEKRKILDAMISFDDKFEKMFSDEYKKAWADFFEIFKVVAVEKGESAIGFERIWYDKKLDDIVWEDVQDEHHEENEDGTWFTCIDILDNEFLAEIAFLESINYEYIEAWKSAHRWFPIV